MSKLDEPPVPGGPAAPRRAGRGLRIALAISVALNLAVVGLVAGAAMRGFPRMAEMAVRDIGFGPYSRALAPEDREALRRAFVAQAPDLRQVRTEMRQDLALVAAALRAEPFDPAALQEVMERSSARTMRFAALGHSLLLERVSAMSGPQRHALADRLEEDQRRGPPRRDGPGR